MVHQCVMAGERGQPLGWLILWYGLGLYCGYLHAGGTALHRSAQHDPGVLGFFQLHGRLPKTHRLGHILKGCKRGGGRRGR